MIDEAQNAGPPPQAQETAGQEALPSSGHGRPAWMILSILLSLAFFAPLFLLMKPASQPSARAATAAKHGFIQLDNEEGALLFQAMQIRRGESIYHSLEKPPYVAGTYTPLYMAAVAALDNFGGNNGKNANFATGRVLSWISALTAAVILVLLVLVITRNPALGVLCGFLFLATWEVFRWIGYFRVDFFAMALSLGGLAVLVVGRRRWPVLASAALLITLGLYAKQTMIAAPAACLVALLFSRPRDGAKFFAWMLAWGIPPMIALEILTGGEFLKHTVLYNMNTWHMFNLRVWWRHVLFMHTWLFAGAAVVLPFFVAGLIWRSVADRRSGTDNHGTAMRSVLDSAMPAEGAIPAMLLQFWQPLAWYALFAQWNFFGIGKAGSAENYLLEPVAGWAIILTLSAGAGLRGIAYASYGWLRAVSAVVVIVALGTTVLGALKLQDPQEFAIRFTPMKNPMRADFEAATEIISLAREAENPFCELAIYNIRSGHDPVLQPFIMSELARQGRWDDSEFVRNVRAAKFDLVVTLEDVTAVGVSESYTQEMLAAFHGSYEVERVMKTPLWTYYVLRPRQDGGAAQANEIAMTL
jgi:hypothetical protein